MTPETRTCQNCKNQFTIEPEDFAFYEKITVPPPTFCPECRLIRRFIFRNERILFRRKDAASGKEIFSDIPPQSLVKVYEKEYWWSDAWDSMDYGRDYDFSRPFFTQFCDLFYAAVPWPALNVRNMVNSDYANHASSAKNCYLCFDFGFSEDSAYVVNAFKQKNCFDIYAATQDELSYEGVALRDCYRTMYSVSCEKCNEVWFSRDCTACSNCFGCANLRGKQYYIFNAPYTREGYFQKLKEVFDSGSHESVMTVQNKIVKVWLAYPYRFMLGWHNTNVSGEWIINSKNVHHSFDVVEGENVKYAQDVFRSVKDSWDVSNWAENSELLYEVFGSGDGCRGIKFSLDCWPADHDMEYSVKCASSSNLFGCVGLKKKSYCIFNKQYTPEEYKTLRDKIIQHMDDIPYIDKQGHIYRYGEFFPPEFSPFAYNETLAQDFFPLTKEQAVSKGYIWRDPEMREYQTTIDANNLPDHIKDVSDSILKEIIKCASCVKAYRIIPMELDFYRRLILPLPRKCHNCRFIERTRYRNQPRFYHRTCQCAGDKSENEIYQNQTSHFHGSTHCPNEFETSYAPDRKEIVYCESCYQDEVV